MNQSAPRWVTEWLADGPEAAPPALLDRSLDAVHSVAQRPRWAFLTGWPRRTLGAPRQLGVVAIMAALLVVIAVAAVVGSHRQREDLPTWTNGRIAFETGGTMWVADQDGSHPRAIETRSSDKREPSFSPDGSMLAFWSNASADGAYRLFVAD